MKIHTDRNKIGDIWVGRDMYVELVINNFLKQLEANRVE